MLIKMVGNTYIVSFLLNNHAILGLMTNDITIKLTSINSHVLDNSVRDVLSAVPAGNYGAVVVEVAPVQLLEHGRLLVRKVSFLGTNDKVAVALAKVDVPHDVNISIR